MNYPKSFLLNELQEDVLSKSKTALDVFVAFIQSAAVVDTVVLAARTVRTPCSLLSPLGGRGEKIISPSVWTL
jgi:hypothetical protein